MFRDKDYLRSVDGFLFNVIGYDHPVHHQVHHPVHHQVHYALVNLKYVPTKEGLKKWSDGYRSAIRFLNRGHPQYVNSHGLISVSGPQIAEFYQPQLGLQQLRQQRDGDAAMLNRLQRTALELVEKLAEFFGVPFEQFGITDSLLWGNGQPDSDIDLVFYGKSNAVKIRSELPRLYEAAEFARITAENFAFREPAMERNELQAHCDAKWNLGLFSDAVFSLRAVREKSEVPVGDVAFEPVKAVQFEGRVVDDSEAFFFPAVYRLETESWGEINVVSFLTEHEIAFVRGQTLRVRGFLERQGDGAGQQQNFRVIVGSRGGSDESIRLIQDSG